MKKFLVLSLVGLSIIALGAVGYAQQLYELSNGRPGSPQPIFQGGNYQEVVVGEKPPVLEFRASGLIDVIGEWNKNVPQCAPSPWTDFTAGKRPGHDHIRGFTGSAKRSYVEHQTDLYGNPGQTQI